MPSGFELPDKPPVFKEPEGSAPNVSGAAASKEKPQSLPSPDRSSSKVPEKGSTVERKRKPKAAPKEKPSASKSAIKEASESVIVAENEREQPTAEALAVGVHRERSKQEELIAGFFAASFASPAETIGKGIELIKQLRVSLLKQAELVEQSGQASRARVQYEGLGFLLTDLTISRERGRPLSLVDFTKRLRAVLPSDEEMVTAKASAGETLPAGVPRVELSEHDRMMAGEAIPAGDKTSSSSKARERADALLADLARMKTGTETGASEVLPSKPKRSFEWLLKPKSVRQSVSPAPDQPAATKTTETHTTPPPEPEVASPTPVPQVETKSLTSSDTSSKEQAIPLMITRDMEQQLADRGIGREDRDKLRPEEAWNILNNEKNEIEETNPSSLEAAVPVTETSTTVDTSESLDKSEVSVESENVPVSEGWTREKIEALTFGNILYLNDDDLRLVLRGNGTSYEVGALIHDMPKPVVQHIRDMVGVKEVFDNGLAQGISDPEQREIWKSNFVQNAKTDLLAKHLEAGDQTPVTKEPEVIINLPPRPKPAPPAPIEQAPATPPSSTSPEKPQNHPARSGWRDIFANLFRRSAPEQATGDSSVLPEVEKAWTLEAVDKLQLQDIFNLNTSDLKIAVGDKGGFFWGTVLADVNDTALKSRVIDALGSKLNRSQFKEGFDKALSSISDVPSKESASRKSEVAQKQIVTLAKKHLKEKYFPNEE